MQDLELKQMWQAYDTKLDKLLVLNLRHFEQLQTQKANDKINSFVRNQVVWILLGVVWTAFLGVLVFNALHNLWFAVSVGIIMVFTAYATLVYLKSVVEIRQINFDENITLAQQKLSGVQASFNQNGRLLFLQAPFYCTWFINPSMYKNVVGMCITLGIAVLFAVLAVWLYRALAPKNMHRPWVKNLTKSLGGNHIIAANEFLEEIAAFKEENLA